MNEDNVLYGERKTPLPFDSVTVHGPGSGEIHLIFSKDVATVEGKELVDMVAALSLPNLEALKTLRDSLSNAIEQQDKPSK